jgi:hypothetical protein
MEPRNGMVTVCTVLTFKPSVESFLDVTVKNIRDCLFINISTLHNFLFILCLNCIYYETLRVGTALSQLNDSDLKTDEATMTDGAYDIIAEVASNVS